MKVKHFPKVGQSHDDTFFSVSSFVLISEMDFVPFYFSFLLYYYEWMKFLCCWRFLFFIKNFNFFAPSLVFLILIILTSLKCLYAKNIKFRKNSKKFCTIFFSYFRFVFSQFQIIIFCYYYFFIIYFRSLVNSK